MMTIIPWASSLQRAGLCGRAGKGLLDKTFFFVIYGNLAINIYGIFPIFVEIYSQSLAVITSYGTVKFCLILGACWAHLNKPLNYLFLIMASFSRRLGKFLKLRGQWTRNCEENVLWNRPHKCMAGENWKNLKKHNYV